VRTNQPPTCKGNRLPRGSISWYLSLQLIEVKIPSWLCVSSAGLCVERRMVSLLSRSINEQLDVPRRLRNLAVMGVLATLSAVDP